LLGETTLIENRNKKRPTKPILPNDIECLGLPDHPIGLILKNNLKESFAHQRLIVKSQIMPLMDV